VLNLKPAFEKFATNGRAFRHRKQVDNLNNGREQGDDARIATFWRQEMEPPSTTDRSFYFYKK
jgi:hypothetical protein